MGVKKRIKRRVEDDNADVREDGRQRGDSQPWSWFPMVARFPGTNTPITVVPLEPEQKC